MECQLRFEDILAINDSNNIVEMETDSKLRFGRHPESEAHKALLRHGAPKTGEGSHNAAQGPGVANTSPYGDSGPLKEE
ncbi:hypothetical protein E2C01_075241 [Portunus trituberculatus]|uniref:Uncharacterized protein n=1 Tax=Portunus trituberculatus TaxID=210409 RepID=A0A5B7IFC0_PORTR|nr:hypothetical protein [Portunus trituberculatus]